jgi:glycosyltransferase involved in cell wall biosynthesis
MLVWKTQTLNVTVASLRYRCLLPLRYLAQQDVSSIICPGAERIKITRQTQAIIFVKSFRAEDVEACEQAYQLGVPIILDLCDNIFIDEYAADSDYVPAANFRLMAQRACAIVTTGSAMKAEVEKALAPLGLSDLSRRVVVIPDGNESLADIEFAFKLTRWQRLSIAIRRRMFKKIMSPTRAFRRTYRQGKRRLKAVFFGVKGRMGRVLRHFGLLAPLSDLADSDLADLDLADLTVDSTDVVVNPLLAVPGKDGLQPVCESSAFLSDVPGVGGAIARNLTQSLTAFTRRVWPKPWLPAAQGVKTVLWFGNHGAKYGNFGMLDILEVAAALEKLSQQQSLRLMVVSNSYEKYRAHIAPLPFETAYLPWHPRKIYDYIRASDVVIIPNSQSVFSICKSANRAVLALSQGTPVVASRTPALAMFAECVWLDDWYEGLKNYLLQPEVAQAHMACAQQVINQHLSGEVIAQQWLRLLNEVESLSGSAREGAAREGVAMEGAAREGAIANGPSTSSTAASAIADSARSEGAR